VTPKVVVTKAPPEETLMTGGEKLNEVRAGIVESPVPVTVRAVGKPIPVRSAVVRVLKLPAPSNSLTEVTVHVPVGLNCGKVIVTESVTVVVKGRLRFLVALLVSRTVVGSGPVNVTLTDLTPARLSVAVKLTVTGTGPAVVSMVGGKLNAVRAGAIVSDVPVTVRSVGKPIPARATGPRPVKLPTASWTCTLAFHTPAGLYRGKVSANEPPAAVAGELKKMPLLGDATLGIGALKKAATNWTPDRSSVAVKLTVTNTGPELVSMVEGLKLKPVRAGLVTS